MYKLIILDYKIDESPLPSPVTSHAGLPAVLEVFRVLGGRAAVERLVRLKSRQRGFSESEMVESLLALLAAGAFELDAETEEWLESIRQ